MSKFIKIGENSYFRKCTITNISYDFSYALNNCNQKTKFSLVIIQKIGSNRVTTYIGISDNSNPDEILNRIITELELTHKYEKNNV